MPVTFCDTASPWSVGTQLWHYEDMLEATYSAPEAVHYFLDLLTECIIEWHDIEKARIGRWTMANSAPRMLAAARRADGRRLHGRGLARDV